MLSKVGIGIWDPFRGRRNKHMNERPFARGDHVRLVLNDGKGPLNRVITGTMTDRRRVKGETHGTVWLEIDGSIQSYSEKCIKELRHAHEGTDTQPASAPEAAAPAG